MKDTLNKTKDTLILGISGGNGIGIGAERIINLKTK